MIIKVLISTLILTLPIINKAIDKSTSPPATDDIISVDATLREDPAQKIQLGKFTVEFENTTLDEIRKIFGSGSIDHSGDAASSQYWLCYSLPNQRIWFISHGEMGGPDHALTQLHVISMDEKNIVNNNCPLLPIKFKPIQFDFGWIGTTQETLINCLGQPSGIEGNTLIYFYHGKKTAKYRGEDVDWNVLGYVEVIIENNKIVSIYVSHVTSY